MDPKQEILFPCDAGLYKNVPFLATVGLGGVVMDNSKPASDNIQKITWWVKGLINKSLFDFKEHMLLRR